MPTWTPSGLIAMKLGIPISPALSKVPTVITFARLTCLQLELVLVVFYSLDVEDPESLRLGF